MKSLFLLALLPLWTLPHWLKMTDHPRGSPAWRDACFLLWFGGLTWLGICIYSWFAPLIAEKKEDVGSMIVIILGFGQTAIGLGAFSRRYRG